MCWLQVDQILMCLHIGLEFVTWQSLSKLAHHSMFLFWEYLIII